MNMKFYMNLFLIGKKAFVPEKSFKTIEQAADIIESYLQELSRRETHLG